MAGWYYLIAAMVGLMPGQAPPIRAVGPFLTQIACEAARRDENPALWRSEACFEEWNGEAARPRWRTGP